MYYKDVEEEVSYTQAPQQPANYSAGYNFGAQEVIDWFKTPVGIAVIVAIVAVIAFLVWWFLIRDKTGEKSSSGFTYY